MLDPERFMKVKLAKRELTLDDRANDGGKGVQLEIILEEKDQDGWDEFHCLDRIIRQPEGGKLLTLI